MTYLGFHAVFIIPPIALLAVLVLRRRRGLPPRAGIFLVVLPLLALLYTTPWDNYLVWRGVWGYGEERVIGTIGYVPIEEYLFFIFQPVLTGLWLYLLIAWRGAPGHRVGPGDTGSSFDAAPGALTIRRTGAALYLLVALGGALLLLRERGTYLGLILAWAAPVLSGQWYLGGAGIWNRRRLCALALAVPTLYLWFADAYAIRNGIWSISERFTTGLAVAGLPMEEAAFFLVTNLLVVQGLTLFLYPPSRTPVAPVSADRRPTTDD